MARRVLGSTVTHVDHAREQSGGANLLADQRGYSWSLLEKCTGVDWNVCCSLDLELPGVRRCLRSLTFVWCSLESVAICWNLLVGICWSVLEPAVV